MMCRNFKADEDGIIITELRTVAMTDKFQDVSKRTKFE